MSHEKEPSVPSPTLQAPQTGLLTNQGTQNPGPASAHSVSAAMMPRNRTQAVPVMTLRPGTGHRFHPSRLATRGPAIASMNGHSSNPTTTVSYTHLTLPTNRE